MKPWTSIALTLTLLAGPVLAQTPPSPQAAPTATPQAEQAPAPAEQAPPKDILPSENVRRAMPTPPQKDSAYDPIAVAQRDPVILNKLAHARRLNVIHEESVLPVPLGSTCAAAGCTETTLVAFTFRTVGIGTQGRSVLALVTCKAPTGTCRVTPAEVRAPTPALPLRPAARPQPIRPQQAPQRALKTPGPTPG